MLIIFGGLPGTGKTTLARVLAQKLGAVFLRIDTIEYAIVPSKDIPLADEGYRVAYAVAEDNLKLARTVIAEFGEPDRDHARGLAQCCRACWRQSNRG